MHNGTKPALVYWDALEDATDWPLLERNLSDDPSGNVPNQFHTAIMPTDKLPENGNQERSIP